MAFKSSTDIVNIALLKSGYSQISDIRQTTNEMAQKSRIFYDYAYTDLMAKFPWPFATKTFDLTQIFTTITGFSYSYQIPSDVQYVWEIYPTNDYTNRFTSYKGPLEFPFHEGVDLGGGFGTIIGGILRSNFSRLSILTTPKERVSESLFSQSFIDSLINEIRGMLLENKDLDADKNAVERREIDRVRKRNRLDASRETDNGRVPEATILTRIRTRRGC